MFATVSTGTTSRGEERDEERGNGREAGGYHAIGYFDSSPEWGYGTCVCGVRIRQGRDSNRSALEPGDITYTSDLLDLY